MVRPTDSTDVWVIDIADVLQVSSSQQLRDELQSSSEITLRVMAVGAYATAAF